MLHNAIQNLYDNVVVIQSNSISDVVVIDTQGNKVTIDKTAVIAEIARLQAEYDAKEYARNRAPEYPSIGDQLDALFKAGVFPADMAAKIQAVKDKYPKV